MENHKVAMLQRAEAKLGNVARRFRHNTRLEVSGGEVVLWLHRTPIVTVHYGGLIQLNTGGWESNVTKNRMNQALDALGADFHIIQQDFRWYTYNWRNATQREYLDHAMYRTDGVPVPHPA